MLFLPMSRKAMCNGSLTVTDRHVNSATKKSAFPVVTEANKTESEGEICNGSLVRKKITEEP